MDTQKTQDHSICSHDPASILGQVALENSAGEGGVMALSYLPLVRKVSKLLALVGSPYDGEALTAARTAHKLLVKHNLTWDEFFSSLTLSLPPPRELTLADMVDACLDHAERLNDWESRFCESIRGLIRRGYDLSQKQETTLRRIFNEVAL